MYRRALKIAMAAAVVYLAVEAISFVGLLLLGRRGVVYNPRPAALNQEQKASLIRFLSPVRTTTLAMDPVIGWTRLALPSLAAPGQASEINAAGMRDDKEYAPFPSAGIVRIEAFGDSFTFSSDVTLQQSWARRLAGMSPRLEVLNYGVGAFGLDQAYLRYLEKGTAFHPHVVFIGYMTENFQRDVNVFRPFYSSVYGDWIFSKPRFQLHNGELVLLKNPLPSVQEYRRLLQHPAEVLQDLAGMTITIT